MVDLPRNVEEDELPKSLDQKDEVPADWEPSPEALQAIWGETDEEFLAQVQAERERLDAEVERDAEALKTKFAPSAPRDVSDEPVEQPEQIELGEEITQEMDTLWQKSVQDIDKGVVKEHAATLVEGQEGEIKLVNPVKGMSTGSYLTGRLLRAKNWWGLSIPTHTARATQASLSAVRTSPTPSTRTTVSRWYRAGKTYSP